MNETLRNSAAHVFVRDLANPQISDNDLHHLHVLRIKTGETVSFADGKGSWRVATVSGVTKSDIAFEAMSEIHAGGNATPFGVAFPLLKGDRTELMLQKLTEIGV